MVNKSTFSIPLIFPFSMSLEYTLPVESWKSCSCLTCVAEAKLWWHQSKMNVIKKILTGTREDRKSVRRNERRASPYKMYPSWYPKNSIGPTTLAGCNMDSERDAVLTQSAIVWTHRVRRPPFCLTVTALDRNCNLPILKPLAQIGVISHQSHPNKQISTKISKLTSVHWQNCT